MGFVNSIVNYFKASYRELSKVFEKEGEGVFLPCSFWLVDNYVLQGRHQEARPLYDRLAGLANDVGLYSEEYDPASGRMLGNMPQAFTHLAAVRAATLVTGLPMRTMH